MKPVSKAEVRSFLGDRYASQLDARGIDPAELADDFDLLEGGVIDSLGLIELVAALEENFGLLVDFEEMDPEQLTIVGPFCEFVAAQSEGS